MRSLRIAAAMWLMLAMAVGAAHAQGGAAHWVGTWATAASWRQPAQSVAPSSPPLIPQTPLPAPAPPSADRPTPSAVIQFRNQTLREIVHTTIGGERLRVVFSNVFGTAAMTIGAASIGLREKGPAIVPGSARPLTFAGQPAVTIPAGAVIVSDPVSLAAPPMTDLAIDLFLPGDTATWPSPLTVHTGALQTNYVSSAGNHTGEVSLTPDATTASWFLIARVEVMAPARAAAIVALGDSLTDGARSTPDMNRRWTDELTRRLQADPATRGLSVLNAGIAGNRLLSDGGSISVLGRFDRDVLMQTGVAYVVMMAGNNDIVLGGAGPSPSTAELIAAYRQLIDRAHAGGVKAIGATLTPFDGWPNSTAEGERKRQAVNEWIRSSKAFDGVIDFDAVLRDPEHPARLLPAYNAGDNLHPGDAGYKVMADAVDPRLFK